MSVAIVTIKMLLKIYFTMVKNYIVGFFTKYYAVGIFAPFDLEKGEFNKCSSIVDGLMTMGDEKGNIDSEEAQIAFEQINKLPNRTIITAYNRILIKTDNGWEKYRPFAGNEERT